MKIIRLCMSFTLELATLWFFHIQKVLGPLNRWASIGFYIGMISVVIICVLEWNRYFYKTNCSMMKINQNERLNTWISETSEIEIDQI
jgi:hypothetical protein